MCYCMSAEESNNDELYISVHFGNLLSVLYRKYGRNSSSLDVGGKIAVGLVETGIRSECIERLCRYGRKKTFSLFAFFICSPLSAKSVRFHFAMLHLNDVAL